MSKDISLTRKIKKLFSSNKIHPLQWSFPTWTRSIFRHFRNPERFFWLRTRKDRTRAGSNRNSGRADDRSSDTLRFGIAVQRNDGVIGHVEDGAGPIDRTTNSFFVDRLTTSLHFSRRFDAEGAVRRVAEVVAALGQALPAFLAETDLAGIRFRFHLLSGEVGGVVQATSRQPGQLGVALRYTRTARMRFLINDSNNLVFIKFNFFSHAFCQCSFNTAFQIVTRLIC